MARPRAWGDRTFDDNMVNGTVKVDNLLLNLVPADTLTVVRIIGKMEFWLQDLVQSVNSVVSVDIGIGVASEEAFAVGGNAIPTPSVDTEVPQAGWLYLQRLHVFQWTTIQHQNAMFTFDIRAARRVDRGILYATMVATTIQGTTAQLARGGKIRALCLT